MGWRFAEQPNGLVARFSEVVDDFTHVNMTIKEAVKVANEEYNMNYSSAVTKVSRYKDPASGDASSRWAEAMGIVRRVHGRKRAKQIQRTIARDMP